MKHTDFSAQIRTIKAQEYKELFAAVETHGGFYEWELSNEKCLILVFYANCIYPNPREINIYKACIQDGVLKIYGKDREFGNDIQVRMEDVFAGHLSSIIDHIPPIVDVDDVTCPQECPLIKCTKADGL